MMFVSQSVLKVCSSSTLQYCCFTTRGRQRRLLPQMQARWRFYNLILLFPPREKIHYIRTEGTQGVEKLSCDADLVILLR